MSRDEHRLAEFAKLCIAFAHEGYDESLLCRQPLRHPTRMSRILGLDRTVGSEPSSSLTCETLNHEERAHHRLPALFYARHSDSLARTQQEQSWVSGLIRRTVTTVLVTASVAAASAAVAAEIVRAGPGCVERGLAERLYTLRDVETDLLAFGALLDPALATGECRTFLIGKEVRVETVESFGLACVRPEGEAVCYWLLQTMVED